MEQRVLPSLSLRLLLLLRLRSPKRLREVVLLIFADTVDAADSATLRGESQGPVSRRRRCCRRGCCRHRVATAAANCPHAADTAAAIVAHATRAFRRRFTFGRHPRSVQLNAIGHAAPALVDVRSVPRSSHPGHCLAVLSVRLGIDRLAGARGHGFVQRVRLEVADYS